MLELAHVSFQYEESDYGVFNIDLRIAAGECVVLIGESGCGKTTVTRLVNALAPAYYPCLLYTSCSFPGGDISDSI